jgi:hypothetical protein
MNDNDSIKRQRLRAALTRRPALALDEARARLPELVMAQMSGEDVESTFAYVLAALDRYPELAEEYALLAEAMEIELGHDPLPVPASIPEFLVEEPQNTLEAMLRRFGRQARGILVQLSPQRLPEPMHGMLSETPAAYLPAIEYISECLSDLDETVQVTAVMQQAADAWELIVSLIPGSASTWSVSAILGNDVLPVVAQEQFVTRFGPFDQIPEQTITLLCVRETT